MYISMISIIFLTGNIYVPLKDTNQPSSFSVRAGDLHSLKAFFCVVQVGWTVTPKHAAPNWSHFCLPFAQQSAIDPSQAFLWSVWSAHHLLSNGTCSYVEGTESESVLLNHFKYTTHHPIKYTYTCGRLKVTKSWNNIPNNNRYIFQDLVTLHTHPGLIQSNLSPVLYTHTILYSNR